MKFNWFILSVLMITGCNGSETPPDTSFSINKDQTLLIKLKSNPSTGYKWFLVNKTPIVDSIEKHYNSDNGGIGAGGMEYWEFKGVKIGTDTLQFIYAREWKGQPNTANTRKFPVQVK